MNLKLKGAGYKLTKPRIKVLNLLKNEHKLWSAEEVYKALDQTIDLVSVYRILQLFYELKILQLEIMDGKKFYYLGEKPHHHIICKRCGYLQCVPCNHLFDMIKDFELIEHQVSLKGICRKCLK